MHKTQDNEFHELYSVVIFCAALWLSGKAFAMMKLPALVGEIVCGIVLGPHMLQLVGSDDAGATETFKLIGNVGLVFLVLEAGLDVDIQMYVFSIYFVFFFMHIYSHFNNNFDAHACNTMYITL